MRRVELFNRIESHLTHLANRIEVRGKLNLLEMHGHAETFYMRLLNMLFGWNLSNLNVVCPNAEGVDLVDHTATIVAQVSAAVSKQKVDAALAKDLSPYTGYTFKFVAISKDAAALRKLAFSNPHNLDFDPPRDVLDVPSILRHVSAMEVHKQQEVCDFLDAELHSPPDLSKIESNLAAVIRILAAEDWSQSPKYVRIPYDIDAKVEHNKLVSVQEMIHDHKIHYRRIECIYSEFDAQGVNKSYSVLNGIRAEYIALAGSLSPDELFLAIVARVVERVLRSKNYEPIPAEELELCIQILVVDAFIRCKIFKNPVEDADAGS